MQIRRRYNQLCYSASNIEKQPGRKQSNKSAQRSLCCSLLQDCGHAVRQCCEPCLTSIGKRVHGHRPAIAPCERPSAREVQSYFIAHSEHGDNRQEDSYALAGPALRSIKPGFAVLIKGCNQFSYMGERQFTCANIFCWRNRASVHLGVSWCFFCFFHSEQLLE